MEIGYNIRIVDHTLTYFTMPNAYIVAAVRTAGGKKNGRLYVLQALRTILATPPAPCSQYTYTPKPLK
jgi:hypothetical protein